MRRQTHTHNTHIQTHEGNAKTTERERERDKLNTWQLHSFGRVFCMWTKCLLQRQAVNKMNGCRVKGQRGREEIERESERVRE